MEGCTFCDEHAWTDDVGEMETSLSRFLVVGGVGKDMVESSVYGGV